MRAAHIAPLRPKSVDGLKDFVRALARERLAELLPRRKFNLTLDYAGIVGVTVVCSFFDLPASRFAMVGAFVARFAGRVGVGITGASNNGVFHWAEAEAALAANYSPASVEALAAPDASEMISDLHGSAEYRAHLVKVMTARAVTGLTTNSLTPASRASHTRERSA